MENDNSMTGCGCFGCLIQFIALIIFCMIFSLVFGSGEFYNDCIKKVSSVVKCDTIQTNK